MTESTIKRIEEAGWKRFKDFDVVESKHEGYGKELWVSGELARWIDGQRWYLSRPEYYIWQ
jgi:hypothetical protein